MTKNRDEMVVWIKQRGDTCHVSCYAARVYIRALPPWTRRWDAASKTWLVDVAEVDKLTATLRRHGYRVISDADSGKTTATSWATMMYDELPANLADRAFKVLSKILHPDAGGDIESMKQLNTARDRARKS